MLTSWQGKVSRAEVVSTQKNYKHQKSDPFVHNSVCFSEKRTGNVSKRRLLVNPDGPEIQKLNLAIF